MDLNMTPEPPIIVEIKESMLSLEDDVLTLSNLMVTSNLQYLTRTVREEIFKRLLDNLGVLEDAVKALVKDGRAVRRARLRDDDQLSRMVMELTAIGSTVGSFEVPPAEPSPEVIAVYKDPATDVAAAAT
jgi:hypothetical protein